MTWRLCFRNRWSLSFARPLKDTSAGAYNMSTQANVLIIEDESIIAADLAYIVEQLGLCVFGVAKTCAEAIALARLAPVSLILSDVRLADGSSGITAVEAILEEQNAAVIFVTASPQLVRTRGQGNRKGWKSPVYGDRAGGIPAMRLP